MKKYLYIAFSLALMVLVSCDEDSLLNEVNPNELSSDTFYRTGAQAEAAVNAVYSNLKTLGLYGRRYFFAHDLLSGETYGTGSLAAEMMQLDQRTYDSQNAVVSEMWNSLYRGIQRANLVLENVPNTTDQITEEQRTRYLAEARFMRAWYYNELVTFWGGVPLLTKVAGAEEITGVPKASKEDVYRLIFEDLDFAEANLPERSEYSASNLGRATKGAARALKGKAYLFRGEYQKAAEEFQKVINSGEYNLVDEYFDNFREETENNRESIFEVQFMVLGGNNNWQADGRGSSLVTFRAQEYGWRAWHNVNPTQRVLDEYEPDDPRFKANFYSPCDLYNNDQDTVYTPIECPRPAGSNKQIAQDDDPSWKKYTNYYKADNERPMESGINFRVIRYADVLLGLAEAKAEAGDLGGAIQLMNQVRSRPSVAMPPYPTAQYPCNSKDEVIRAIYHERAVEFAGEQVLHRDLLRRPDYLKQWVPHVQLPMHLVLPIPQTEIDNNNAITAADQNPGY